MNYVSLSDYGAKDRSPTSSLSLQRSRCWRAVVGKFVLLAVAILGIVFPIMGGIKASNGELWKYPMSIPFFSVDEEEVAA